jgi:hypothetical protein
MRARRDRHEVGSRPGWEAGHEFAPEVDVQLMFALVGMKFEKAALGGAAFLRGLRVSG